jgi:FkbM family methyltransferase
MAVYGSGDIVSDSITFSHQWEPRILSALLDAARVAKSNSPSAQRRLVDLVDVGANVGWFTFAAAASGLRVRAYEPFRQNINLMRYTACLNPKIARNIELNAVSLGNSTQTCYVVSETGINLGDGHTVCSPPDDLSAALRPGYAVIGNTAVRRLDDMWDGSAVSVWKMDVEGYEMHVLAGASKLFDSPNAPRVIFTEFFPSSIEAKRSVPADMLRFLVAKGYACDGVPEDVEAYAQKLGHGAADLRCERRA